MLGVIHATIMSNPMGRWYIELKDEEKDITEYCLDFLEFEEKIEKMGEDYGGMVEVVWSADENVTKEQINEIRMLMKAWEARKEAEEMSENPFGSYKGNIDLEQEGGFDPNS